MFGVRTFLWTYVKYDTQSLLETNQRTKQWKQRGTLLIYKTKRNFVLLDKNDIFKFIYINYLVVLTPK